MAAKPTDDIDRDFIAMIAPDHQGAIAEQSDTSGPVLTPPGPTAAAQHNRCLGHLPHK
jgi:hypothetical protein